MKMIVSVLSVITTMLIASQLRAQAQRACNPPAPKSGAPFVDVKAWGAKGDGITDDTTAIQCAINSLSTFGGTVFFTAASAYAISAPLLITKGVILQGVGRDAAVIKNNHNGDAIKALDDGVGNAKDIVIQDLVIQDAMGTKRTQGAGVHIDGQASAARFTLRRVHVLGHFDGFLLGNHILSVIEQCRAESNRNHGFNFTTQKGNGATTTVLISNYAIANSGYGFYFSGGQRQFTSISDAAQDNRLGGIFLDNINGGTFAFTFDSSDVESNAHFGFKAVDATDFSINAADISSTTGSPGHGIMLNGVRQGTLNGVLTRSNVGAGLQISNQPTPTNNLTLNAFRSDGNGGGRVTFDDGPAKASYVEINAEGLDGDPFRVVAANDKPFAARFSNASAGVEWAFVVGHGGDFQVLRVGAGSLRFPTPRGTETLATQGYSPNVENTQGGQQNRPHMVVGTTALVAGSAVVSLGGGAAFSSATSYSTTATDTTQGRAVRVSQVSGQEFKLIGTGRDKINFICVGN